MKKDSQSHPLRIDSVKVPGTGGQIGMTFCPGKKQIDAMSGAWDRDLDMDLQAIKDWGATVLVSLIEEHEFSELGVRRLSQQAETLGLEWRHFPIRDVSIPSFSAEKDWQVVGNELVVRLDRREKVVLHCKGGLGRTGMMAACLLREFGVGAGQAIAIVREARHGAIESEEQEKYVMTYAPVVQRKQSWKSYETD